MTSSAPKKSWKTSLRDYLVLGLLTLAPLGVTIWVLASVVRFLDELVYQIVPGLHDFISLPGIGIALSFCVLFGAGLLAKTVFGRMFSGLADSVIDRVPVVRGLYGLAKQVSSVFFSQQPGAAFKKVVWVPFPGGDARTLALVAGQIDEDHVFVFVPTAPNPISGYVLRYHRSQLEETSISVDAALQIIISCGAISPGKPHGH
jgi:uncharacterized membrane protein